MDITVPLNLISYLRRETEWVVWSAALHNIESIYLRLQATSTFGKFRVKYFMSYLNQYILMLKFYQNYIFQKRDIN